MSPCSWLHLLIWCIYPTWSTVQGRVMVMYSSNLQPFDWQHNVLHVKLQKLKYPVTSSWRCTESFSSGTANWYFLYVFKICLNSKINSLISVLTNCLCGWRWDSFVLQEFTAFMNSSKSSYQEKDNGRITLENIILSLIYFQYIHGSFFWHVAKTTTLNLK